MPALGFHVLIHVFAQFCSIYEKIRSFLILLTNEHKADELIEQTSYYHCYRLPITHFDMPWSTNINVAILFVSLVRMLPYLTVISCLYI